MSDRRVYAGTSEAAPALLEAAADGFAALAAVDGRRYADRTALVATAAELRARAARIRDGQQ